MATAAQSTPEKLRSFAWLGDFLREELAPYPGRGALVGRMLLATSIVMILVMTFRLPYGAYGAIYALTLSRENPDATVKAVKTVLIGFSIAVADVLLGAVFFSGEPLLRLLWVGATFFFMFFALSSLSNYTAAARFGYLVVITTPLWDRHISAELKVENTLWAIGSLSLASVITAILEVVFHRLKPGDDLSVSIAERLERVKALLDSYIEGAPDTTSEKQIHRLSMLGTSRLRRVLQRSGYSPQYAEQMGAVVAYVGRLVDLAANLTHFSFRVAEEDKRRLRRFCATIETVREDLVNRRAPQPVNIPGGEESMEAVPLLREMENTMSLIAAVFEGTQSLSAFAPPSALPQERKGFFVPDAFTNPAHLHFALKGGLAAFICYIAYSLAAWPEINTAVTTCLLTSLSTIGSSRQKQVLRFSGALTGGAIGLASQVFILPSLDSIVGFWLLFATVMTLAAWIATSGPRLSYFGVQVAVAFDLINLSEFKFQTSLTTARDRVAGIMLGLFVMWLIFDQLWGASAVTEMKRVFISNIRMLAQLARGPVSKDLRAAIDQSYSLRESINANFDRFRQHADGVMLEFGPSRELDLNLRAQLLQWQFQLRMFFIARIALLKYRLQLPGFELPAPIQAAQKEFDDRHASILEGMADSLAGKVTRPQEVFGFSLEALEDVVNQCCAEQPPEQLAPQLRTFLPLSRRADGLIRSLDREI